MDGCGDGICPSGELIRSKSGFGKGGLPTGSKPLPQTGASVRFVVNGGLPRMPGTPRESKVSVTDLFLIKINK